jgi:hypothetical protein
MDELQAVSELPEQMKFWSDFDQSRRSKKDNNLSVNTQAGTSTADSTSTAQTKPDESFNSAATGESGKTA